MKRPIKYKNEVVTGWAVYRAGYWLVCPTYTLAVMENKGHKGVVKVELHEVKGRKK